jgi:hypothetical protein
VGHPGREANAGGFPSAPIDELRGTRTKSLEHLSKRSIAYLVSIRIAIGRRCHAAALEMLIVPRPQIDRPSCVSACSSP